MNGHWYIIIKMGKAVDLSESGMQARGLHPIQSLDFDQVQVQIQIAPLTPENMLAFHESEDARIRQLLSIRDSEVPRRAIVVLDGSNQLVPPAAVRRIQAEWMTKNSHMLRTVIHSMGVVIPNAVARGAFTAVMWLAGERVPWDMVAHPDLEAALSWAVKQAHSIGGTVSPDLMLDGALAVERKRAVLTGQPLPGVRRRAS